MLYTSTTDAETLSIVVASDLLPHQTLISLSRFHASIRSITALFIAFARFHHHHQLNQHSNSAKITGFDLRRMANRMKEDEKNERAIRNLLKLPKNRRCINCNSLGPQYVCTNFWTFVCTTCSGIHREFTHRVKSVSMAKFTSQEVSALQGGGNEHAREIYFKELDPQRHSAPDSSNVEKLRDFIKHVYVDRRYTGERSVDKPPRAKTGDKDDFYESKSTYGGGSRSPPYEDTYDRRSSERSSPGGRSDDRGYKSNYDERRSPGYGQETRYGDHRKSPVRFEVVDDRHRDDRFGNGRRSEERRFSDAESKLEGRSPNRQNDLDATNPPMVRPVRDILGDDVPPLRIGEPPKANIGKGTSDVSAHPQRSVSSSSLASNDGGSAEPKSASLGSLIDFSFDPEPPLASAPPPTQQTIVPAAQSVSQTITTPSIDDGNWASFDFAPQPQVPSNVNTLESMLFQLAAPSPVPAGNITTLPVTGPALTTAPVSNISMSPVTGGAPVALVGNLSTLPTSGASMASTLPVNSGDLFLNANDGGQWPQFASSANGTPSNQHPWNSSPEQNVQGLSGLRPQPSQVVTEQIPETSGGVASQSAIPEAKTTGRKELPEDLFAATFSTVPVPGQGWHAAPSHGMRYGMQYPTAVPMPTYPHPSKASNPFDLSNESTLVHAPSFPNMSSLQGALPNMGPPPGLLRTSSLGNPSPQWMPPPQSLSYASAGQSPSYAGAMTPSPYMRQQLPNNMAAFG
ncbi:hypothetical protein GIB67_035457 [Kingdonia uniflora]|uniref:Arf-GAP domain-containing protein n=1 Tax=Kingdonia uniflora TaxID=39325 RepID=A0A7J7P0N2_9MAGN|nr:hypothetical protein GIB67_035457 [Kingdonia uniflora]